jgi:hypothetical protein
MVRRDNAEPANDNCIPLPAKLTRTAMPAVHEPYERRQRYAREGDANDIFLLGDSHFELIRESARKIGSTDPKPERSHG